MTAKATDALPDVCPRCGSRGCFDPDSKGCSDNCITRHIARERELQAALRETCISPPFEGVDGDQHRSCARCHEWWRADGHEHHAEGCLAALRQSGSEG